MRPRWLGGAVAATVAVLAALWAMPAQSGAICQSLRAPWVERQLRELPKVNDLPANGRLSVGRRLRISQRGIHSDVVVEGGGVGYEFSTRFGRVQLRWPVAIRLVRLNPGGSNAEEVVTFRRGRIGKVGGLTSPLVAVRVPDEPGIYRVDLFIRNRQGRFLRKISRYLIGTERTLDVRMDTDRSVYSPGDEVRSEVENIGTQLITFMSFVVIQREVDGKWVNVASGGPPGEGGEGLEGGSIGGCASARLPDDAPPGSYRARRSYAVGIAEDEGFDIELTAPFEVR